MSDSTPAAAPSAGALIRAAREKQGLHIAALAAAIKVAPRKLDALENDRWNELPDATFTRALAQTVCRSLKIDAKPVLDLLPPAETSMLEPSAGAINEPFRERASRDEGGLAALAIKPMVIAAALLMVAAIAVYLMPTAWWQGDKTAGLVSTAVAPAAVAPAASTPAEAASAAERPAAPTPAPATVAVAVVPATAASGPAPASGETVFSAPPPSASAAAAGAAANGTVQLRANEASWVEVRDARGRVLLSRTVQPGESIGLDGEAPFRLVIGNAAATELSFRGQPVSLAGYTRDAVARLELK